jgi:hypothetical protein
MRIRFTLLIDDGTNHYYRGAPGIFIADYADLLGWKDERDELFWEQIEQHYYRNAQFDLFVEAGPETTIHSIETAIATQIGFDLQRFSNFYKWICILVDGQFVRILDTSISLSVLSKYYTLNGKLCVFFVFSNQAGEIWNDDGLRYYMHSKESGQHNEPHVHVDYKHEASVSICLYDGRVLDGHIPSKVLKKVQKKILSNQQFLFECWNKMTDGLRVDINHYFNIISLDY